MEAESERTLYHSWVDNRPAAVRDGGMGNPIEAGRWVACRLLDSPMDECGPWYRVLEELFGNIHPPLLSLQYWLPCGYVLLRNFALPQGACMRCSNGIGLLGFGKLGENTVRLDRVRRP